MPQTAHILPLTSAPSNMVPMALPRARRFALGLRLRVLFARLGPSVRRAVDILGAGVGLIVLAPLFLVVAALIKLDDPGPIFYRQTRVGKGGRRFSMWKLRTMVVNAEHLKAQLEAQRREALSGARFKLRRDPRITRVGRVLRKLSIDELPQLYNVLVGDMTIIGPRPPVPREVALYDDRAMRRLEVPQGLTCIWQVEGRSDIPFEQQVELDIDFIDRTTAKDELRIFLATIPAVLTGRGAY